ncbi:Uncharacterised protein [Neisseria meningitidis]|nr:Uncharacterised protein [Neisseria meningitidis]
MPSASFLRPLSTFVSATSTVTTCLLPSVFADTVAEPVPTNSTSLAFLTAAWNALSLSTPPLFSFVVLSDESTQPKPAKSPTVAALFFKPLSVVVAPPTVGVVTLLKSTNWFLASLPLVYLDKPLLTLVISLLPALMPSLVTLILSSSLTVVPAPTAGVMVKPSLLITVVPPFAVLPKVMLVKPVKASFSE